MSSVGKVYKIVCNITKEVYIGSTGTKMSDRMTAHRSDARRAVYGGCKSMDIINRGNYDVVILEEFPYQDDTHKRWRERHYYDTIENVNKCPPIRTEEEKRQLNIERCRARGQKKRQDPEHVKREKERTAKYREENVEYLAEQAKNYRINNAEQVRVTKANHYQANKEKVKNDVEKYRQNNAEKVAAGCRRRYEKAKSEGKHDSIPCGCGGSYTLSYKKCHETTTKHTNWVADSLA